MLAPPLAPAEMDCVRESGSSAPLDRAEGVRTPEALRGARPEPAPEPKPDAPSKGADEADDADRSCCVSESGEECAATAALTLAAALAARCAAVPAPRLPAEGRDRVASSRAPCRSSSARCSSRRKWRSRARLSASSSEAAVAVAKERCERGAPAEEGGDDAAVERAAMREDSCSTGVAAAAAVASAVPSALCPFSPLASRTCRCARAASG